MQAGFSSVIAKSELMWNSLSHCAQFPIMSHVCGLLSVGLLTAFATFVVSAWMLDTAFTLRRKDSSDYEVGQPVTGARERYRREREVFWNSLSHCAQFPIMSHVCGLLFIGLPTVFATFMVSAWMLNTAFTLRRKDSSDYELGQPVAGGEVRVGRAEWEDLLIAKALFNQTITSNAYASLRGLPGY